MLPVLLLSVSALLFLTVDERYVAAPMLVCFVMVLWLWMTLWNRDQKIPFFDVGIFCSLATLLYTVYPLVNYWVDGFQFGLLSDSRLHSFIISPRELGFFHMRHVLYLLCFIIFYSIFRGGGIIETGNVCTPSRVTQQVILLFFLLFTGYFFLLQITTGVNYNFNYESENFANRVATIASMPLILIQISGRLGVILFVFKLALLFIVVSRCRQKKWRFILLIWIAVEIVQVLYIKGARTSLVLFLMATGLFYHRMIRPLSVKFLMASGTSLFIFFIFFGLYRGYYNIASLQADLLHADSSVMSIGNEFQGLLGTAYDVYQRKADGVYLPWYLYINDIISILPPQQFMPFEKVPSSEWYLREIGMSGTGQGFMWGVVSQSIVGLDWLELALRGAILGYILARFHRWYLKHQTEFFATLLYIVFCLKVYYTFRDTTFSFLTNLIWEIIPFYIILRIGVTVLSHKVGNQQVIIPP